MSKGRNSESSPNAEFKIEDEDHEQATPQRVSAPPSVQPGQPARRESAAEAAARIRAERDTGARPRNLNGMTLKLEVHGTVPGYQLAVINDDKNRIREVQMNGWQFVQDDEIDGVNANVTSFNTDPGSLVRFAVGTKENGEPLYGYLMKLPLEIWEEDQAAKEQQNAKVDSIIKRGRIPGESDDERDGRYTNPFGVGIGISNDVRRDNP
jgi:hypothetical protein